MEKSLSEPRTGAEVEVGALRVCKENGFAFIAGEKERGKDLDFLK